MAVVEMAVVEMAVTRSMHPPREYIEGFPSAPEQATPSAACRAAKPYCVMPILFPHREPASDNSSWRARHTSFWGVYLPATHL
jgi:hypothetical protein